MMDLCDPLCFSQVSRYSSSGEPAMVASRSQRGREKSRTARIAARKGARLRQRRAGSGSPLPNDTTDHWHQRPAAHTGKHAAARVNPGITTECDIGESSVHRTPFCGRTRSSAGSSLNSNISDRRRQSPFAHRLAQGAPAHAPPQHFLYFFPLPHGHGSLRPTRGWVLWSVSVTG